MLMGTVPNRRKVPTEWPQLQKCDRDGYALVMQGLATIVRIAQQAEDNKHALAAGQWLVTYGEGLWREKHGKAAAARIEAARPSEREAILSELRGLYAKALGSSPLVVDAKPEPSEPEPATEKD